MFSIHGQSKNILGNWLSIRWFPGAEVSGTSLVERVSSPAFAQWESARHAARFSLGGMSWFRRTIKFVSRKPGSADLVEEDRKIDILIVVYPSPADRPGVFLYTHRTYHDVCTDHLRIIYGSFTDHLWTCHRSRYIYNSRSMDRSRSIYNSR